MKLIVILDHRFFRDKYGSFYGRTTYGPNYWERYLSVFDSVRVISRSTEIESIETGLFRVDSDKVSFAKIPDYHSPLGFLVAQRGILKVLHEELRGENAIILRIPSNLCYLSWFVLLLKGKKYGVELTGDPEDSFSKGAVRHPFRLLFKWIYPFLTKLVCRHSSASNYVTEYTLQRFYPPGRNTFHTYSSSIDLLEEDILGQEEIRWRMCGANNRGLKIISVGSFSQLYKGQDILVKAVSQCRDCVESLTFVGHGRYMAWIQELTNSHGMNGMVHFVGSIPSGAPVYGHLDQSDLFVLPSRQEGLPRAIIEAMARGLPCVASSVGGIQELLDERCLVSPNDAGALSKKIKEFFYDRDFMNQMSLRNLRLSSLYSKNELMKRRIVFYKRLSAILKKGHL